MATHADRPTAHTCCCYLLL